MASTGNVVSFREHQRRRLLSTTLDLTDPEVQYRLFRMLLPEWLALKSGPFKLAACIFGMSIMEGLESVALSPAYIAAHCRMNERRVRLLLRELEAADVISIARDGVACGTLHIRVNLLWRDPTRMPVRAEAR